MSSSKTARRVTSVIVIRIGSPLWQSRRLCQRTFRPLGEPQDGISLTSTSLVGHAGPGSGPLRGEGNGRSGLSNLQKHQWALRDLNPRPLPCKGLSGVWLTWRSSQNAASTRGFMSQRFASILVVLRSHVDAVWSRIQISRNTEVPNSAIIICN